MITAGIDCGAKNTKTVIIRDGQIIGKGLVLTGFDPVAAIRESREMALKDAGIDSGDIDRINGTGSGKMAIKEADSQVNDIKAMGKAAHYFFPNAHTVADVGAEEGRVAKLDDRGNPEDFAINEKCAAGAGAFIEAMSRALETPLEELGVLANASDKQIPMNSQCAIFAESEVVSLIHAKIDKKDISKAIHDAIAARVVSMIRRIGGGGDLVILGGVGHNPGFVSSMKRQLRIDEIKIPGEPEFGMAVGAAVAAAEEG